MKKLKNLSMNEKVLIAMLIIAAVLVATSWGRISEKSMKVFNMYSTGEVESTK